MKIYLVRHGDAVSADVASGDHLRWLSGRGREASRILARLLREQGVEPDAVVSSPLPRALQTAELVASGLDYLGPIEVSNGLAPGAHPRVIAEDLPSRGTSVVVVGHEPTLAMLGAILCNRPAFPAFRTAQACAIVDGKTTFTARPDTGQVTVLFID